MNTLLRTGALILFVCILAACGGGSSGSPSSSNGSRGTDTSQPDDTNTDPDDGETEEPPPVAADLTTNVFFPVMDGMALYYDDGETATVLGETIVNGDERVFPLQHPDERVEYITSTTHAVGLKGLYMRAIDGATPVYIDLMFDSARTILGNESSYRSSGDANITITGIAGTYNLPVTLVATRVGNEQVEVAGLPAQPARRIRLDLRLTVDLVTRAFILLTYPWAEPFLDTISLDMWFVPGIGIARIQQGQWQTSLTSREGIPQPHVFSVLRLANVNTITPVQIQLDGEAVTDDSWESTVYYRTTGENWLDVTFDETGSWRARITRTDLTRGVYAATVRFTQGDVVRDATVSLLVR